MIAQALRNLELDAVPLATPTGRLVGASGLLLEAAGCRLHTGQRCQIETVSGEWLDAQVVGFREKLTFLMPFKKAVGLTTGARVLPSPERVSLQIGPGWLGRMVNGLGEAIDGLGKLGGEFPLDATPPRVHPLKKKPVSEPLDVGVRAINAMLTLGKGQRVGLMAGSGVGKSVLLGLITRQTVADVVVVGLIGERSREVREFVEMSLGKEGMAKAVLVIAPADENPLMRIMATELCHSIAAHYRDQGKNVLLLVDSLTRYAMALREVALALAERGHYPAIDIPASISRCMTQVISKEHMLAARALKASMARQHRVRDLIPLGAYVPGADPLTDQAVNLYPRVEDFLCQGTKEAAPFDPCVAQLEKLMT